MRLRGTNWLGDHWEHIEVDDWDRTARFSYALLNNVAVQCGDEILIVVSNGKGRYRIVADHPDIETVEAVLVEAEIDIPSALPPTVN